MDPFIGQIILFGGNFAPRGWALCDGTLLPISSYSALFSILGTTYGGDGRTTFALPDLRGRAPIHAGQGTGLSDYDLGQSGGAESLTLTVDQLPSHTHSAHAAQNKGKHEYAKDRLVGAVETGIYNKPVGTDNNPSGLHTMATEAIGDTGGGQAVSVRGPYLAVNYIIATEGTYPSRS